MKSIDTGAYRLSRPPFGVGRTTVLRASLQHRHFRTPRRHPGKSRRGALQNYVVVSISATYFRSDLPPFHEVSGSHSPAGAVPASHELCAHSGRLRLPRY